MHYRERDQLAWYRTQRRDAVETLAAIQARLLPMIAADDEASYDAIYTAEWMPAYLTVRRTLGGEIARSIVDDAHTLAALTA